MNVRKVWKLLILMVSFTSVLQAQSGHSCPSDAMTDSLLNTNPIFSRSFFYMEQKLAQNKALPVAERTDDIYTLPVVVHVIHKGEPYGTATNITDEQINSAITALNQDFRHMPGTPGYGTGPDIKIQFCLAARDPQGQTTTGIVRINGSSVSPYSTEGIASTGSFGASESAIKALSTWPNTSYVNIWVVSEIENNDGGNGIQGYAYFPTSSPLDGVVILYNAFGTVGNLKSNTDMNRVLTHEMGHYFSLYHTFHGSNSCSAEANCTTAGDRVCDTPVTTQNASCSSPACSGTQQVENYMDYTPESCQNMFTEGQKLRMRTSLETQRTTMLSSLGCVPVFTRDAGITAIIKPSGTQCAGGIVPQIRLTNFGSSTLTSVTINYNVDGTGSTTQAWTGSLLSGTSVLVDLNGISPTSGAHSFYAWTSNPNGQSDQNTVNDQSTTSFVVASGATATLVVTLDYLGVETTWQVTDANNDVVFNGGPYINNQQGLQYTIPLCLSPGCYTLTFTDAWGDGQGLTNGNYILYDANNAIFGQASGNWGAQSVVNFCITGQVPGNAPVASFTIQDNSVCKNTQVDFTSTSTNTPTSYLWTFEGGTPSTSTIANPQNIVWANSGTYDVTLTATNASGSHTYLCPDCMTIYASPTLTLSATNPSCNNGTNGAITSAAAGNGPFTYLWSNGATTSGLTNLTSGSYTCTVTNTNGCTAQSSATITNPTAIVITGTATNVSCGSSNNGSITVSATGGTGNKTFSWSNGATGATANNLTAGSYTVTATDTNGCTKTQSFTITSASSIVISGTATNVTCNGLSNGSITVSATGGTGNKTFTWSNGATGATANNLAAGSYTVTATDAAGCTNTQSYTITTPSAIVVTGTATNISCNGATNGSITVSATGGTGSKTFSWSNGATGATVNNLAAGNYTVTATDANGCTKTQSFTITAPTAIVITGTATNVSCGSTNNGSITVSATGGTGNKTFTWSNGATGATANNLTTGSYTVTATDASGCTKTQSFTITSGSGIVITGTPTMISCNGLANGSITVSATGGTGNKTFSWSNGATGATINNLASGSYTVTALDAAGCSNTHTYTITAPTAIVITGTATNVVCNGVNNGNISVSATGGTGNKTFTWSNGATGASISNLAAGSYTVTATDASGCTKTQSYTITAPTAIVITGTATNVVCNGVNNGSINVSATGGTGNKTFTWSNGATGATLNNLAAGNYTVTATDANGCTKTQSYTITAPTAIVITGTATNVSCGSTNNGSITVSATGGTGNKTFTWSNGATGATANNLTAGTYTVTATDANGCTKTQTFSVTSASGIVITGTPTMITCNGLSNGSITVSATGGTGNKTFTWSNGATGASINNLAAGTYIVTATDAAGCSITQSYAITSPSAIVITGVANNISCNGINNGNITVSATGGTGNKTFSWSNGSTGATLNNLAVGNYSVTATDANGCTKTQSFTITAPTAMVITANITNVLCNGNTNGSITVSATGGTGNKTFSWSNGSTGATRNNLAAGSYTVTATDANGCTKTQTFNVSAPAVLQVNVTDFDISCTSTSGSAQVVITGGTSPYTVNWSNGSTGNSVNNLAAGNYSVNVIDAHGCNSNHNFNISQSANLSVYVTGTSMSCHGMNNGTATAIVNNGNNCTYLWNTGATSPSISGLSAGTYSVVVTASTGCQGTAQVTITEPAALSIAIFKSDISCFGLDDGTAMASVTGGVLPYSYEWSEGQTTISLEDLDQGVYTFSVVDANACVADESVVITEPDMLTASMVVLTNETCAGDDGSAIAIVSGGSPNYNILWSNGQTGETITGVSAGQYSFEMVDANGCELAGSVNISNVCIQGPSSSTKLIESDCNSTSIGINSLIKCEQVENALMYQWQFRHADGSLISNEYSLGHTFYVSQIPGIAYSMTYRVAVKAMVASVWGEFGDECSIGIVDNPLNILTGLTADNCGSVIQSWGETLIAEEVPGVYNYQWHITGINYDWTAYSDINVLLVDENMGLQSGQTYSVQIRCSVGAGQFSEWGPICTFTVGLEIDINEFPQISGILLIYPNPGNGENIFFNFGNLPKGSTVEDLTIFDSAGNLVEVFNHIISPETGQIQEYRFEHKLATGMYHLTFKFNGSPREERLIVK